VVLTCPIWKVRSRILYCFCWWFKIIVGVEICRCFVKVPVHDMSPRVVCSLSIAVSRHTRTGGMSMGGMGGPGGMDMASLVSALS
jgi:hypothetical protein